MQRSEDDSSDRELASHRRRFLQGVGVTGATGLLAGCLGGDDSDDENGDDANGDDDGDEPEPASFEVTDLDPAETSLTRGSELAVEATIENTGEDGDEQTVEFHVDGDVEGEQDLDLDGGDSDTVEFDAGTDELAAGDYDYAVVTDDDEAMGELTVDPVLGDSPDALLTFDDDPLLAVFDSTATVAGTLENPYDVTAENIEIDLSLPDGWEIEGDADASFGDLGAGDSQEVGVEVSVPADAEAESEMTADVSYSVFDESADVSVTIDVSVVEPLSAPFGLDCGGELLEEGVEIDDLEFHPTAEQRAEIDLDEDDLEDVAWWPDAILFDPIPNPAINEEGEDIEGTEHDALYWTEYWQDDQFSIDLMVENGDYEVVLHFAEVVFDDPDEQQREFSAFVNGQTVVEELNLTADVGFATATTAGTVVTVTDNQISVDLDSSVENPKLSAVEIREADLESGVAGHYDANALAADDGDALAAWADATGEGLDLTQDDEDAQPTYHADGADGNATIRFEGNTDFGEGEYINSEGVPTESTAGVTMAVAFNTHDVTAERQTLLYNGSDDNGDGYGIFVNNEGGSGPDSEGYLHVLYGGVNWYWSDTAVEEDQFHVATLTISEDAPDQPELRLDGQLLTLEDQVEANPPVAPSDQFSIGQDTNDGHAPPYFHGDIGEAVVYDWELPTDQREELENQLGETWGVDVSHEIDGLAGHWAFDEESVEDGTVVDQSGHGHDGEIRGGVETGLDAPVGGAAAFDGESEEDVVVIESDDALNPSSYTVSLWMQTEDTQDWSALFAKEDSMWCGTGDENNLRMDAFDDTDFDDQLWGETDITDGEWHHVVFRHDADDVSQIFIDGELEDEIEAGGESDSSDFEIGIGAGVDGEDTWDHYTGQFADVRLYDRPLGEAEIGELFDA
ncbi:malectin domain-containing carbohydrate-binding protein [Halobacteria archaeon AArc-dxtr1]|nr:malectin domain-containing carbohydrate-binding protein [Halobacteria archaeon AArc-dxtr1]